MKTRLTWLLILMLALTVFWGCSDDDNPVVPDPTQTAFEKMAAAGALYVNDAGPDCPGVLSAASLEANLDLYTVIDIRRIGDYLAGHIPGAYHSTLPNLLADLGSGAIPAGKTYVVTCYTGQSAGHAKIAMELTGYGDVKSLTFGMSAWNTAFEYDVDGVHKFMDNWTGKCADALAAPETANQNALLSDQALPTLSGSITTVVADRVNAMLNAGFKGITYEDYLTAVALDPDEFFILNYFGVADYEGNGTSGTLGHIPGAFQFTPYASLGINQMLDQIPTDKTVVVYCWTGQHSSQITAYLNMLGYRALSLKFGSNHLFHTSLTGHKWTVAVQGNDFALEMGHAPTETFTTIATALLDYVNDGLDCPGVFGASDLNDNLSLYTVIDVRSIELYDLGHIDGAIHTEFATLKADIADGTIPTDKPIVVACKTGQSAGHFKIALEMMGYEDTKSLKWGMSSWNAAVDSWSTNTHTAIGAAAETTNNNGDLEWNAYPALAGETLETRVDAMLAGGFKSKSYDEIKDYLGDFFVLNYFGELDYAGSGGFGVPGHIEGAFQFTPYLSMGIDEMLGNIPMDIPVVVYCWTGQHSSQITAYLNMLGYDAYSLRFGSNDLFYDQLTGHKWTAGAINDFTLVPTPALVANF